MTQRVKVQGGHIVYETSDYVLDPNVDLKLDVNGQVNVTKEINVGNDPLADGEIQTPDNSGVDLILKTNTDGIVSGNIKFEPAAGGNIVLDNVSWPDGSVSPVPGMYLGSTSLNTLQFQSFVIGSAGVDTLTQSQLNIAYPNALPGQMVTGVTVLYQCVGTNQWRILGASLGYDPVNKAGDTMLGDLILNADPTQPMGAATKQYVDSVAAGISTKPAVYAATTTNLSATYNNGTSGVGATLTANSNGPWPGIDGVTGGWILGKGVLVKNQTDPAENGRYNLTQLGDGSTPWILTRCGLCDTANEIPGSYVFVQSGSQEGTGWVALVADPSTYVVGVDAVLWTQFSSQSTGQPITINDQVGNYTIQLSDAYNTLIRMTSASPVVVTIENDSNINLPVGTSVLISWNGVGSVSVSPASGVTIVSPDSLTIGKQYGKIVAIKTGPNYWEIEGNLAP